MFNFSANSFNNLNQNGQYQFCMNYAMQVFKSNAIYSLIPKNGCSTLRLSVAIANGCINGIEQGNWCSGQLILATDLYSSQYLFSDSFGVSPPL
jgi:hypothetical protein